MKVIKFTDTEGREVDLQKPFMSMDFYQIRIDGVYYGDLSKVGRLRWVGVSGLLSSEDLEALAWIVEEYEALQRIKPPLK